MFKKIIGFILVVFGVFCLICLNINTNIYAASNEEKVYCNATIDENFDDDEILMVVLDLLY